MAPRAHLIALCVLLGVVLLFLQHNLTTESTLYANICGTGSDIRALTAQRRVPFVESGVNVSGYRTLDSESVIVQKRFIDRKNNLNNVCNATGLSTRKPPCGNGYGSVYQTNNRAITYCAVEKSGSTFWKRILQIVGNGTRERNPSKITPGEAYSLKGYHWLGKLNSSEIQNIFNWKRTVMFVRNPYGRLFSGWLDKLYNPNVHYWKGLGLKVVNSLRQNNENKTSELKCGYDTTFEEFLTYITDAVGEEGCFDGHFAPNHVHCNPCHNDYAYIGKYETLKQDTVHVLEKLDVEKRVQFDDFEVDANRNAIRDSVDWVFGQKQQILDCNVSFHCALFKTWNRLQARGIIGISQSFPLSPEVNENMDKNVFYGLLLVANIQSSAEELSDSRKLAYVQAHSSLPESVLNKVKRTFNTDFQLFDYNLDPVSGYESYKNRPELGKFLKQCTE